MGGGIELCPKTKDGACFRLELRLAPPSQISTSLVENRPIDTSSLVGAKILLAEDNKTNRLLIHKYLGGLDLQLKDAHNGHEAVARCIEVQPDIILMDMSMPQQDGLAATREIRALKIAQPVIIALTANAFDTDREACLAAGMDYFLQKPINKTVLLQALVELHSGGDDQPRKAGNG